MDFFSLLNAPEADLAMGDPPPFDESNIDFKNVAYPPFDRLAGNSPQTELFPGPTAAPIPDELMAPSDASHPSAGLGRATNPSPDFLHLDNARLQNSNEQLADEVRSIGGKYGEVQAQLSGLRDGLRQLGGSLEELLYLPAVRNGDKEVTGRLFEISNTVTGIRKALGSGGS